MLALADIEPGWTLTGGAALAGFHLRHRDTRDLDLFWHGLTSIADVRRSVVAKLKADGFEVHALRTSDTFSSLEVVAGEDKVVVDLVAEPVLAIEDAEETELRGGVIRVDTPHEILVNKLGALLHRSELRDLIDIQALLQAGGDFDRALVDAARKDGGFSAMTLSWALQGWDVATVAREAGSDERAEELEAFRRDLMARLGSEPPA